MTPLRTTLASLLALSACLVWAQAPAAPEPKPATLLPGMGALHFPITTASAEAQRFFDQGLTLVYAFNHDEAARAFRRASELDPRAAMPYWGLALALGPNYNDTAVDEARTKATWDAIGKARALSATASDRERAYVDALARRFSPDPKADVKALWNDYRTAMRDLAARYPEDLDAATLYAESLMILRPWQLWATDGTPAEGTPEILATLESVLRRDPSHAGANHLYVHAVEASKNPERALPSAKRLETLVPGAGHLVHMPAHIYIRTGDYAGAGRTNEAAAAADRAYMDASGVRDGMYPWMYYSHNLHFIAIAYAESGQLSKARQGADALVANVAPHVADMPMLEGWLPIPTFVLLRFQRWDDVLALPQPGDKTLLTRGLWHFARGVALAAKKDVAGAQKEREAFAADAAALPPDTPWGLLNAARAVDDLAGRIAEAKGQRKAAIELWTKAVAAEDGLNYDEPPAWYYPVRESLGGALLRDGRAKEAEAVFHADLERNPRNPRSLFGLMRSLEAQKRTDEAEAVRRRFDAAWHDAEVALRVDDL